MPTSTASRGPASRGRDRSPRIRASARLLAGAGACVSAAPAQTAAPPAGPLELTYGRGGAYQDPQANVARDLRLGPAAALSLNTAAAYPGFRSTVSRQ